MNVGFRVYAIDCKSIFEFRAIALMLSGESFFGESTSVGYGVRR